MARNCTRLFNTNELERKLLKGRNVQFVISNGKPVVEFYLKQQLKQIIERIDALRMNQGVVVVVGYGPIGAVPAVSLPPSLLALEATCGAPRHSQADPQQRTGR